MTERVFLMMAQYGATDIPLDRICGLFGLSEPEAKRAAAKAALPVPAFRAGGQKSPWLVSAATLAGWLDAREKAAQDEWQRMKSAA